MRDVAITERPHETTARWAWENAYTFPDGTRIHVRSVLWERRENGFPDRLWLYDTQRREHLIDPLGVLPDWLAATAPAWTGRTDRAVG